MGNKQDIDTRMEACEQEMHKYAEDFCADPMTKEMGVSSVPASALANIAKKHGFKWSPAGGLEE